MGINNPDWILSKAMRANKQQIKFAKKRQWGAEKRTEPLPTIHDKPSTRMIAFSRLAIIATIVMWTVYVVSTILRQFLDGQHEYQFTLQAVSYLVVVTFLTFSALMYLVARQGALQRFSDHVRTPRAELDRHFMKHHSSITVLVPSYSEEPDVIRKTLMSAALQEYPEIRVVLLLDDNPNPSGKKALERLNSTRALGKEIEEQLSEPRSRFEKALKSFEKKQKKSYASANDIKTLADHYLWAAQWLRMSADNEKIEDHVDLFFADQVLRELADELQLTSHALIASRHEGAKLTMTRLIQLYRRLAWTFTAKLDVFERKKYVSLSHESNKAMNLNSYIGLMGGSYKQAHTPEGPALVPAAKGKRADLTIPDSDFLLTLDADSILLRDYCLRLVYFLQQPDNYRVAVTQTPYSSFRGASSRIERLAAATTDIQHILHQGMSHYNATFWVGANAIIRKKALEDIVETERKGGYEIKRYIQDRTVIEDTESSVDLALHGWSLVNYPERLSYSATPPDFGSLVVQRRRWANGGLLILPKLWAVIRERNRRGEIVSRAELLLRINYMASLTWASFGLIFLLAYPYDGRLLSPFVLLAALPYFLAMASDLKYCGYKRTDVLRIYGFNLILLPVNLAGVLKSMQQALTGQKIPFARTPKVKDRTVSPMIYVLAPMIIIGFSLFTLWRDINMENWANAAFAGFNAIVALWATAAYIGLKGTIIDIWVGLTSWLYIQTHGKNASQAAASSQTLDWESILYHGSAKGAIPHSERMRISAESSTESAQNTPTIPESVRKLSFWRVSAAILGLAAVTTGSTYAMNQWQAAQPVGSSMPWYAPYVDVTATPTFAFDQVGSKKSKDVVLSFVVASKKDACNPSWGSVYDMDQASAKLDLDRRIARLRDQGGNISISFGGLKNDELAVVCKDNSRLIKAYSAVINRYKIDTIDLDLENDGLNDTEAGERHASAIAAVQQERRKSGKQLAVWVTLPVTPQGLSEQGTNAVAQLLKKGVDIAGVNAMTMDYGQSLAPGQNMFEASKSALTQVHRQLGILYEVSGTHLNSATIWTKIGATPMIGQNDIRKEVFTLNNARDLNRFAHNKGLGRMSMWSANRDLECGSNYTDTKVVSTSCSGVKQTRFEYMDILSQGFKGKISGSANKVTKSESNATAQTPDDPAKSPYQIWFEDGTYLEGTKVVWHHNVYKAKWWTQGDMPDDPVLQTWQTPWELVGPVLPGEKPIQQFTLPEGTYPTWGGVNSYNTGDRVLFNGVPYQAKWWNTGQSPAAASSNPNGSPWTPLTQSQIDELQQ